MEENYMATTRNGHELKELKQKNECRIMATRGCNNC